LIDDNGFIKELELMRWAGFFD